MHLSDPLVPFPVLKALSSMYCGSGLEEVNGIAPGIIHPLQAPDFILRRWPACHLLVGGLDPLLDDSCDLRTRLRREGNRGSLTVYRRLPHAFFSLRGVLPDASKAIDDALSHVADIIGEGRP
jgi:acetyl esterase/lipase